MQESGRGCTLMNADVFQFFLRLSALICVPFLVETGTPLLLNQDADAR